MSTPPSAPPSSGAKPRSSGSRSASGASSRSGSSSRSRDESDEKPGKAEKRPRLERFPIDRSFEVESARRGLETLPWSLRLMSASSFLLAASAVCSLASIYFAYRQPPAEIYVATTDGGLFLAPSVMNPHGLQARFDALSAESRSLRPTATAAKQTLPTVKFQSTGPDTQALSTPDADAVGPTSLGGPVPPGMQPRLATDPASPPLGAVPVAPPHGN